MTEQDSTTPTDDQRPPEADAAEQPAAATDVDQWDEPTEEELSESGPSRRSRAPQIVLVASLAIVVLAGAALVVVLRRTPQEAPGAQSPAVIDEPSPEPPPSSRIAQVTTAPAIAPEPVSWRLAEAAYQKRAYELALRSYRQLHKVSRTALADPLTGDFFQLRVAQCLGQLGQGEQARQALLSAAASTSPIVRAMANHQLACYYVANGQYVLARMKAYAAVASLGLLERPSPLEKGCDFLVARSLTEKALSYYNIDADLSWEDRQREDPFAGLKETALRELLHEGARRLGGAVLGPKVQRAQGSAAGDWWTVFCLDAPLEELLHRFADASGVDVKWLNVEISARHRAVAVGFSAVSEQRLGEVACGVVGLLARFTGNQIVVYDPQSLDSLAEQKELLAREAISAWQRFFLRYPEDRRVPQGHFALACLHECTGQTLDALREYQLVAHRFRRASVVPSALLRSARLRIRLRDYPNARADLLELLDRYPSHEATDQVYLHLGEAAMKADLLDESIRAYRKLFYLNLSPASQSQACLGAARCFYRKANYEEAAKWARRYVGLVKDPADEELPEGYLLFGRCAAGLGNYAQAAGAFRHVLSLEATRRQRFQAFLEIARVEAKQERFVAAIAALDQISAGRDALTPEESYEFLSASARIHRSIGLAEKAISILRRGMESVPDPQMRAALGVEMARAHADAGELNKAREMLTELVARMQPSPLAYAATCELAEICLKLGKTGQAVTVAKALLKSACPAPTRRRALDVLGQAYLRQKEYKLAALALADMLAETPKAKDK